MSDSHSPDSGKETTPANVVHRADEPVTRRGRRAAGESRASEICQRLSIWKQTPESVRPSLRALGRELGTSHTLLQHYLDGLEKWKQDERRRRAKLEIEQISARAQDENRPLTPWEEDRIRTCDQIAFRAMAWSMVLRRIKKIKRAARCGPLDSAQFAALKTFARQGVPGAAEALRECLKAGLKRRIRFSDLAKETPRLDGEQDADWMRRIWDKFSTYEVFNVPTVISTKLLERYSR